MRSIEERLQDILESCEAISQFLQTIESSYAFRASRRDQNAVLHELAKIGEAASHVSLDVQQHNPDIPWQAIKNFRNIIIHEYFGVDMDIVWEVVTVRIPLLASDIQKILNDEQNRDQK
jgi:uncharacterized protein with HEPN domain